LTYLETGIISLAFLILILGICNANTFGFSNPRTHNIHDPLLYIAYLSTKSQLNSNTSNVDQNISIKEGQEFELNFKSNPTTGFEWIPVFDKNILNQTSHTFRPMSALVGAGGTDIFTFKGISPGTTTLKLQYKRSWEKDSTEEKVFLVKVT
jgi:predicted secreted protein